MTLQGYIPNKKIRTLKILFFCIYIGTFAGFRLMPRIVPETILIQYFNLQVYITTFLSMIAISWFIFFWMDNNVMKNIIFIGDHYVQIKNDFYEPSVIEEIEIQLNKNINPKKEVNKRNRIKFRFKDSNTFETMFNIEGEFVKNLEIFKDNYQKIKINWC